MSELRVIACASFRRDGPSALHDTARGLREGDRAALVEVTAIMLAGLVREAPDLAAATRVTLVPMVGHRAGTASGPADRLAVALRNAHPGWSTIVGLERLTDAPRARDAGVREPAAEAATIRWRTIPGTGPLLLVDDVVHTGASLEAAWLAAPEDVRARLVALAALRALD